MKYNEMRDAVEDARRTQKAFNEQIHSIGSLLCGNLRNVSRTYGGKETLAKLKKELTQFNANTGEWKS